MAEGEEEEEVVEADGEGVEEDGEEAVDGEEAGGVDHGEEEQQEEEVQEEEDGEVAVLMVEEDQETVLSALKEVSSICFSVLQIYPVNAGYTIILHHRLTARLSLQYFIRPLWM